MNSVFILTLAIRVTHLEELPISISHVHLLFQCVQITNTENQTRKSRVANGFTIPVAVFFDEIEFLDKPANFFDTLNTQAGLRQCLLKELRLSFGPLFSKAILKTKLLKSTGSHEMAEADVMDEAVAPRCQLDY